MATTPYTQDMLDALKKSLASGTLSITYEGKQIHYRTLAEMQGIINMIQRELDTSAGVKQSRSIRFKTSRGLDGPRRGVIRRAFEDQD